MIGKALFRKSHFLKHLQDFAKFPCVSALFFGVKTGGNCLKTRGIVAKRRARGSPMGKAETAFLRVASL